MGEGPTSANKAAARLDTRQSAEHYYANMGKGQTSSNDTLSKDASSTLRPSNIFDDMRRADEQSAAEAKARFLKDFPSDSDETSDDDPIPLRPFPDVAMSEGRDESPASFKPEDAIETAADGRRYAMFPCKLPSTRRKSRAYSALTT